MKAINFASDAKSNEIQKYAKWLKFYYLSWKDVYKLPRLKAQPAPIFSSRDDIYISFTICYENQMTNVFFNELLIEAFVVRRKKTLISIRTAAVESMLLFSWDKRNLNKQRSGRPQYLWTMKSLQVQWNINFSLLLPAQLKIARGSHSRAHWLLVCAIIAVVTISNLSCLCYLEFTHWRYL